jgi:hypothetical protein
MDSALFLEDPSYYYAPIWAQISLVVSFLPSHFQTKILYTFFISPMRAISLNHPILLELFTLIIFGEGYKLFKLPHNVNYVYSFLHDYTGARIAQSA